eukprot:3595065-Pyramimonas_sp.AAC.1
MVGAVHVVVCSSPGVEDNPAHAWRLQCWVKSRLGVNDASFGAVCRPQVAERAAQLFLHPEGGSAVGPPRVL